MPYAVISYVSCRNKNGATTTTVPFPFDGTKNGLLKEAGKFLLDAVIPQKDMRVETDRGKCLSFNLTKRGTYKENGITYPSMYIPSIWESEEYRSLPDGETPPKCFLTCIHPESNNYKAYIIEPDGNEILCSYGSIDDVANRKVRTVRYPADKYWIRYYEKLSKGYIDQSDIFLTNVSPEEESHATKEIIFPHPLYEELHGYARHAVTGILQNPMRITKRQIEECRIIWNALGKETTVPGFNSLLEKLLVLSPRKRAPLQDQIAKYLANSPKDFDRIIRFEDSLICAMEGNSYNKTDIGSLPIVANPGNAMKTHILSLLPNDIAPRVTDIYKIVDIPHREAFDLYCQERNITNIQKLWHGSRNENWLSIIKNGLLLNPNAVITGKMFGNGIYFAPNPKKSYGYTSCQGSYWANGNSDYGFMGLYDAAVGQPYYPTTLYNAEQSFRASGKDCLYAKKGNMGLYNDEVVFYNQNAICLSYLVKIKS